VSDGELRFLHPLGGATAGHELAAGGDRPSAER
jgi:hypothetical protein